MQVPGHHTALDQGFNYSMCISVGAKTETELYQCIDLTAILGENRI